jgi:hypothetical protein
MGAHLRVSSRQRCRLRIGPSEDGPCPTRRKGKLRKDSKGNTSTYAALQRPPVDIVAVELTDGHGGILMSVHLDEGKPTIRLEARLGDVAKVLEEGHQISLRGVGREIANVARSLPLGSLRNHHVVALNTVRGEVVMSEGGGGCHSHGRHGLHLGHGRLTLLICPVATDGARTEPFTVHGAQRAISIGAIAESDEAVAARPASLHVPHDARFRDRAKRGKGLEQHLVVDLIGQITDEDMEVVRSVLLGGVVRLVSPVYPDFLSESASAQSKLLHRGLTLLWMRRPLSVAMPRSAAPGSSYSTNP